MRTDDTPGVRHAVLATDTLRPSVEVHALEAVVAVRAALPDLLAPPAW